MFFNKINILLEKLCLMNKKIKINKLYNKKIKNLN